MAAVGDSTSEGSGWTSDDDDQQLPPTFMRRLPKGMHFGLTGATLFYETAVRPGACMFAERVLLSSHAGSPSALPLAPAPIALLLKFSWLFWEQLEFPSFPCPLMRAWISKCVVSTFRMPASLYYGSRFTYHMLMKFGSYWLFPDFRTETIMRQLFLFVETA